MFIYYGRYQREYEKHHTKFQLNLKKKKLGNKKEILGIKLVSRSLAAEDFFLISDLGTKCNL